MEKKSIQLNVAYETPVAEVVEFKFPICQGIEPGSYHEDPGDWD